MDIHRPVLGGKGGVFEAGEVVVGIYRVFESGGRLGELIPAFPIDVGHFRVELDVLDIALPAGDQRNTVGSDALRTTQEGEAGDRQFALQRVRVGVVEVFDEMAPGLEGVRYEMERMEIDGVDVPVELEGREFL